MDAEERNEKIATLEELVRPMGLPPYRTANVRWLHKHLAKGNADHENFPAAQELIEELYEAGVR